MEVVYNQRNSKLAMERKKTIIRGVGLGLLSFAATRGSCRVGNGHGSGDDGFQWSFVGESREGGSGGFGRGVWASLTHGRQSGVRNKMIIFRFIFDSF